ncbi:MAG TPA: RNA 2',3'-cyclic phosphodiesterase [Gaiellaceae bacterium]|jgi:2'-5' RNA ligase|nr:RNA 2',3'-cyclic phosphodiesterase [Gaiellaceae bacterium]
MNSGASVGGDERLRLFLALRLPRRTIDAIERWQRVSLRDVRVVPRAQLHVTLAFLGTRPAADLDPVLDALRQAAATAGDVRLTPTRYRETRSVGMLLLDDGDGAAGALADDLQRRLESLGVYRRERRIWLPHLTVARFRERPHLQPEPPPARTFVPSDAAAYLSRLRPGGAEYHVLESVALGERVGGE